MALGGSASLSKPELDALAVRFPNRLHMSTTLGTTYFFLNTRVPPFDDIRARRAVNSAFDRDAFARLLGRAYAPTCQILPPNFRGYQPTCPYGPSGVADLETARPSREGGDDRRRSDPGGLGTGVVGAGATGAGTR